MLLSREQTTHPDSPSPLRHLFRYRDLSPASDSVMNQYSPHLHLLLRLFSRFPFRLLYSRYLFSPCLSRQLPHLHRLLHSSPHPHLHLKHPFSALLRDSDSVTSP